MTEGIIRRRRPSPILLDQFRGAAAAYSLRQLSSQISEVVRVRRSVDNSEQDFTFTEVSDGTLERFVNAGDVAPADYGTGAAAAYSLRHVSDGYTGDVVRVRRSVDNTEQDFNPTEIEDGTLTSFVGGQNLLTYSEQFDDPSWIKTDISATKNIVIAPDGTLTGNLLETSTTGLDVYWFRQDVTSVSTQTNSIYVKYISQQYVKLRYGSATEHVLFDLVNGTKTESGSVTGTIANVGNGWYRLTASRASSGGRFDFRFTDASASDLINITETKSVYIWGAQLEEGTTAGDYVPTTSTIAGDGHVTTWYDQSGNSNDATQATAASQPKIVSGGSLVTENGKPAIDFDGVDDAFEVPSAFTATQPITMFLTVKQTSFASNDMFIDGNGTFSERLFFGVTPSSPYDYYMYGGASLTLGEQTTDQSIFSLIYNQTSSSGYRNSSLLASGNVSTNTLAGLTIGDDYSAGNAIAAKYQEIIVYPDDQSSNRELIETNVNHYYSIYSQTNDGFVTTWYDQSGNANHATQATASAQPTLVSAGSVVLENGKPAIDFDGVDDVFNTGHILTGQASILAVHKSIASDITIVIAGNRDSTNQRFYISSDASTNIVSAGISNRANAVFSGSSEIVAQSLQGLFVGSSANLYYNSGLEDTESGFAPVNNITHNMSIGALNDAGTNIGIYKGFMQEVIAFPSDQSSNRQQIESNINTHYGIY